MFALVTGATGHVGSHVARELLEHDWSVRALVRPGADLRALDSIAEVGGCLERVPGDLLDPASLRRALDGIDVLFQAAAVYRYDLPAAELARVNVQGARNLLLAAEESSLSRVVFTSSSIAVGSGTLAEPADEDREFDLQHLGGAYVSTKREAEETAFSFSERGLDLVVVNPSFVLGPGDFRGTPSTRLVARVLRGEVPGVPMQALSPVDVRDVARGHRLAAERGRPGARYLLAGQNVTVRQLFRLIEEASGVRAPRLPVPSWLARASAVAAEAWGRRRGKPSGLTRSEASLTARSFCFDSGRAERELGFVFRPARAVVAAAVSWCRESGLA
ncbi:MAG: NAD-dependent epimerase/dehydratase family protein [Myxococcota bacterium]